jgi:hypothetical protein
MKHRNRWLVVIVPIIAGLQLSACQRESPPPARVEPAHVEHIDGSELSRVTLTTKAMERLDVQTAMVREVQRAGSRVKVVPYAAVIYDAHGNTWVYTSPEPQVFVRHEIDVDYIEGDVAVLSDGPPGGTEVVTVGVAELFGTEFEIGH